MPDVNIIVNKASGNNLKSLIVKSDTKIHGIQADITGNCEFVKNDNVLHVSPKNDKLMIVNLNGGPINDLPFQYEGNLSLKNIIVSDKIGNKVLGVSINGMRISGPSDQSSTLTNESKPNYSTIPNKNKNRRVGKSSTMNRGKYKRTIFRRGK
tara:strand:- start:415 stop:873 length:459 start_codon:yes stop_codon:yes gene_type:complete